jgi:hypothetical protein
MSDIPAPAGPALELLVGCNWRMQVINFDAHPIPVFSVEDTKMGWRHYAMNQASITELKRWLNAPETEAALAVGVQGKAN